MHGRSAWCTWWRAGSEVKLPVVQSLKAPLRHEDDPSRAVARTWRPNENTSEMKKVRAIQLGRRHAMLRPLSCRARPTTM